MGAPAEVALEGADPALEVVMPGGPRYGEVRRELPRSLPFLPEPGYRAFAANVPGDAGFDPFNFCTDVTKFVDYREAELKHGRLAMIAAVGWPLAEVADLAQVDALQPDFLAATGGRVLPQLSEFFGDAQFVELFAVAVLVLGSIFELVAKREASAPGDFAFDPLGLKDFAPGPLQGMLLPQRRWMAEAELKHARLAMLAIFYDVWDEVSTGNPVVEDTEYIFHKIDAKFLRWEYWLQVPEVLDAGKEAMENVT